MPIPQELLHHSGLLNHRAYFQAVETAKANAANLRRADGEIWRLESTVLEYLRTSNSHRDPQALELLMNLDGSVNVLLYWPYLAYAMHHNEERERLESWTRQYAGVFIAQHGRDAEGLSDLPDGVDGESEGEQS